MNKFAIRLLTLAMLSLTLVAAPVVTVVYAAPDNDPPPPDKSKKKKSSEVHPGTQQTAFADGYRAAYATIYDRHDYASAIEQLKALGRDDSAAVANLIGYSYRKLGDYKVSQIWYERALKADPNHVKTWQYYGLWQVEQGNRDQAQYHLNKIAALAGTASEEYRSLAAALEKPPGTGLVYCSGSRASRPAQPSRLRRFCFDITSSAPRPRHGTPAARRRGNRTCGRRDRRQA